MQKEKMFNTVEEIYNDFKKREDKKLKQKKRAEIVSEFIEDVTLEAWTQFGDDEDIVSKCDDFCYEIKKIADRYFPYESEDYDGLFLSCKNEEEYPLNNHIGKINSDIKIGSF